MGAGKYRERIILQYFTSAQDSFGWPVQTWVNLNTIWAEVTPLRGDEFWEAHKETAEVDTKFRIRYLNKIRPSMRIYWRNKTYKIFSIIDVNARKKELEIMAKEQVDW